MGAGITCCPGPLNGAGAGGDEWEGAAEAALGLWFEVGARGAAAGMG